MEKIYRILKRYPGLNEIFQIGDIVYEYKIKGDNNPGNSPGKYPRGFLFDMTVYKKPFSQSQDPWIPYDHVLNPEFFEEIDESRVTIKISE